MLQHFTALNEANILGTSEEKGYPRISFLLAMICKYV